MRSVLIKNSELLVDKRDNFEYYDPEVKKIIKKIKKCKHEKLGKLAKLIYRYPTFYGLKYLNEGIWVVKGENVIDDRIQKLGEDDYISKSDASRFPKTILQENDIVMSVRGTIGKCAIVPKELENKAIINANMIRIVIDESKVNPKYIHSFLVSDLGQKILQRQSTKAVQSTITVPFIEDIDVPIPDNSTQNEVIKLSRKAYEFKKEKIKEANRIFDSSKKMIDKIIVKEGLTVDEKKLAKEIVSNKS